MSLNGSLEDLGLGEILQIISLSQKSGVLSIRGEGCEGTIVLHDGLVRSAFLKESPNDLRCLLVDRQLISSEDFDRAGERAQRRGTTVAQAVSESTSIPAERIDSLRREAVEAAVIRMFTWQSGEFSFTVQTDLERGDPQLLLPTGINAQYLAMEGARLADESAHEASDRLEDEETAEVGEALPAPTAGALLGVAVAERVATESHAELDDPDASDTSEERNSEAMLLLRDAPPVVVIAPDLLALEWIKQGLNDFFPRVHMFQRWDLGLNPIRQYLARAVKPLVLVRVGAPGDPLSGIRSAPDFVSRLKAQQPRMHVMWLREDGGPPLEDRGAADGVVTCPNSVQLHSPGAAPQRAELATAMRNAIAALLRRNLD